MTDLIKKYHKGTEIKFEAQAKPNQINYYFRRRLYRAFLSIEDEVSRGR